MSRRRPRVLWVVKGLGLGGAERLVDLCARRLPARGVDVEIAYVLPHKDALVADLRAAGIPAHDCGRPPRGLWPARLAALARAGRFDLLHTHSPLPAVTVRVARRCGTPVVHTEHNVWGRYHPGTRWANARTIGANALVYGVSRSVAASVRTPAAGGPAVRVLHHGIDPATVHHGPAARAEARRRLELGPAVPVLGHVANFTPKKAQSVLLEAFVRVRDRLPEARLVMVGTGPLEQRLRTTAADLGLDGTVRFTGRRDDVPRLLPAFDVFALTSRYEGLPIALIEAMAAGVPCVTTPVGGTPEVLDDGVEGHFVPIADPEATARTLAGLLTRPRQRVRMARAARQRAAEFTIDRAVDRMVDDYRWLLDHHREPARADDRAVPT